MNRTEWWMAACVAALVVGVGVGRAQEKSPSQPTPSPVPKVLYVPAVPADPLTLECMSLEAIGCKIGIPAVQAAETNCRSCPTCKQGKENDCCGECAKSKKDVFASGGEDRPVKKVKKIKKRGNVEYFQIAVPMPAPCMLPPPPTPPMTICAPGPYAACPNNMMMPVPAPPVAEPMMVFRAVSHAKHGACGSNNCDSDVQQAKHETHGKITFGIGVGLTSGGVPMVQVERAGQLEIDCGGPCRATCEKMTLHLLGGKEFTIATTGKQVVVTGPSLKATCDTLSRTESEGSFCLLMQGHVYLHHGKAGMKADVESEQVRLLIHDGMVEVHTITTP
jgi:hypothetical protein